MQLFCSITWETLIYEYTRWAMIQQLHSSTTNDVSGWYYTCLSKENAKLKHIFWEVLQRCGPTPAVNLISKKLFNYFYSKSSLFASSTSPPTTTLIRNWWVCMRLDLLRDRYWVRIKRSKEVDKIQLPNGILPKILHLPRNNYFCLLAQL